ncbi:CRISPR-associated endonuclease/helicase Cas3 [Virgibacillus natechei]|uniref:CRISPR-associated endonuclease/helicase Cas3 n=1 Tax=Virgibacillus natechei TaxID=1216297 RepID=A0ABS4INQ2_9BACI|nr:CRISPR-associated helicase Cas3' [Virgibacillus natechei]MBP1971649.1 CRISPR-associated endonuclease/helicase Cas3 [Virgibacillus natechei]UZD13863.1 CRISPR-associated helicase Cas3' [Virgibacillus natechei]
MLLAHIRQNDFAEQSVQTHIEEVAFLARQYGEFTNLGAHSELAGFLHDMGKFTQHFTTYLKKAVIEKNVAKKKIDHSTAGAKYLYNNYYGKDNLQNYVVETIGMAILSHHSGLQNFLQLDLKPSDYLRRVTNEELPYYDEVVKNFESIEGNTEKVRHLIEEAINEFRGFMGKIQPLQKPNVYLNLMQKLVFSCLIDADRTNTRCFEENEEYPISDNESVFDKGYKHLMETVADWQQGDVTPINKLRNEMSEKCDQFASESSAIYTLTIPTGGGKTFASLRYALKHAQIHYKSRIIYVVPYTTILEQNADAVRDIIKQPDAVLEHHANVIDDDSLDEEADYYQIKHHKKLQLGRDNWDYPIVFTTMVQFLDAFYQKGTRKSRRLHNLTNAVIVFDEVQSVPFQHYPLFNTAVNFLNTVGNSSILLCTATQPAVDKMETSIMLKENAEMVPNLNKVVDAFKRVSIHNKVDPEGWGAETVAEFVEKIMQESNSVLIILNTKTAVRKLYELLAEQETAHVVHLSTSMCPAHRKEQLEEIKGKLGKEKVICISTQLIEAGVDISFESVVRSLAGLDSIAQAAGRCNRNGELETGDVYIVRAKDEHLSKLPEIRIGGEVTLNYILSDPQYADNLLSPEAIKMYFTHFQAQANREILKTPKGLDNELISLLDGSFASKKRPQTKSTGMFKTVERYFEAISSPTTAVLVPFREGKNIITSLNEDIQDYTLFNQLMKKAQQYSVNLYEYELQALDSENLIESLYNDSIYCLNDKAYNEQFGVTLEGQAELETYNF